MFISGDSHARKAQYYRLVQHVPSAIMGAIQSCEVSAAIGVGYSVYALLFYIVVGHFDIYLRYSTSLEVTRAIIDPRWNCSIPFSPGGPKIGRCS